MHFRHVVFGSVLFPILAGAAPIQAPSAAVLQNLATQCAAHPVGDFCPGLSSTNPSRRSHEKRAQELQSDAAWGLARISQRNKLSTMGTDKAGPDQLPRRGASQDWSFTFDDTWGTGVLVYVVDSGVWSGHSELTGRVENGWVAPGLGGTATQDVCDHGTAVASLIAGTTLGVAKKATIVPVRIVDSSRCAPNPPESSTQDAVPGINWAVSDFKGRTNAKGGVINVSWQVYQTAASEQALTAAIAAGMHVLVSAGNNNKNQCLGGPSPAALQRVKDVGQIVVGGTDWDDARMDFGSFGSNFGPCVTLFAPGMSMVVAKGETDGTNHPLGFGGFYNSGTSFATPLVSGVIAALISSGGNMSPADMRAAVVSKAVQNAGIGKLQGSPDVLLQSAMLGTTAQRR
ncbi:peptidase S8/S53 domain-containing protein [Mycena pura]|uniref:Peptidase S8/S53 domain-containing protein n=1 Tax=Mycena pura TaxID=153505 RepID=A0AAD6Y387_9AGAR|nr:peptidase S8/S53 domain-containing protein [Mycena pura]